MVDLCGHEYLGFVFAQVTEVHFVNFLMLLVSVIIDVDVNINFSFIICKVTGNKSTSVW